MPFFPTSSVTIQRRSAESNRCNFHFLVIFIVDIIRIELKAMIMIALKDLHVDKV